MTTRLSRLNELSAHLDTIELGRYDEEGDSRMLKDAAILGTGAAGAGGAGLYLRNRGDAVNAARHAKLLKAGAGKLKEGMEGPTIPAKFEDFRGSSWNAVKTGAKDATGGIRSKLAGLLSKLRISRGVPTIKASAKHERLVELSAELDEVVEFGRAMIPAWKVPNLHQQWAVAPSAWPKEARDLIRKSALDSGVRYPGTPGIAKRKMAHASPITSHIPPGMEHGWPNEAQQLIADSSRTADLKRRLPRPGVQVARRLFRDSEGSRVVSAFSSRHENLITLNSELDDVVELSLKPGRGARLISRLDELAHASGRKIDSKTLSFLQDHVRSNKMTGLMGRMKGYDAPRTLPDAGEALTDQLRSIAKTAPRLRALSAELDKVIELGDGYGDGIGTAAGIGAGGYYLNQRGKSLGRIYGLTPRHRLAQSILPTDSVPMEGYKLDKNVKVPGSKRPMTKRYTTAGSRGVVNNIAEGAMDLLKSGKSKLRALLK